MEREDDFMLVVHQYHVARRKEFEYEPVFDFAAHRFDLNDPVEVVLLNRDDPAVREVLPKRHRKHRRRFRAWKRMRGQVHTCTRSDHEIGPPLPEEVEVQPDLLNISSGIGSVYLFDARPNEML